MQKTSRFPNLIHEIIIRTAETTTNRLIESQISGAATSNCMRNRYRKTNLTAIARAEVKEGVVYRNGEL